jgi:two-component system, chemotaxis family, response regulator Rcp1
MHILLVEDNPHDIFFVHYALKQLQHPIQVSVVQDGQQALAFLFNQAPYTQVIQPDIVLLDINMPDKSGFDILAALEQDPRLKFIPVIVLTTSTRPEDINRCYELGANAYLEKPIGLDTLVALMKSIVDFWGRCKFRMRAHTRY